MEKPVKMIKKERIRLRTTRVLSSSNCLVSYTFGVRLIEILSLSWIKSFMLDIVVT